MIRAYKAVKTNGLGIRQAAEVYKVDYHSLLRRVSDACPLTAGVGKLALLSETKEAELAKGIILFAECGWGLRREKVRTMVGDYLTANGRGGIPGPDWICGFLGRNPEVVTRKSEQMSIRRMKNLTLDVGEKWFQCIEETFKKYNIVRPEQVFNCDETGFCTDPAASFVLAKKGSRVVTAIGGSGRTLISVLGCGSAAGKVWPPLVLYKAKNLNIQWTQEGHPGAT